jgi:hypothetical protein
MLSFIICPSWLKLPCSYHWVWNDGNCVASQLSHWQLDEITSGATLSASLVPFQPGMRLKALPLSNAYTI